ncbi:DUF1735 domain-containing protein [Pedobacter montanisoli]|uniref:DUF1735 domain-containing protein n=1 Tax=Pedobacter montanisoli TaxID=2923277 RepID=A0ABS9ZTB5_9SPHI|nr:DUF1735 domain-containing protein [Pedobacter montanisoli]MCJ0741830.1 DUF1735 domain-containing protein [Pedobacter montanisoli]
MKNFIKYTAVLAFLTGSLTSCLKDKTMIGPDSPGAIKNVIEFKNIGGIKSGTSAPYALYIPFTLDPTATTAEFEGIVNYAGTDVAPNDITVNIAADPAMIATYNAGVSGANYAQLAATSYSFPSTVTIPKGQREAKFKISVKPNTFDATKENALALRITSASTGTISGNFGAVIFSMPLKSIWQGTYTVRFNNNYGGIDVNIGDFTETGVKLETVGPNKLQTQYAANTYSGYTQYQFNGNNTSITSVTVFSGSILASSVDGVDLIDPVNGKFTIRYTFAGRGMTETWVRTGP